jgi:hypothetical protein
MPSFADLAELPPAANNGIPILNQLSGIYHPGNVGGVAGL